MIAREFSGEQPLHQRPVDDDRDVVLLAPGDDVGFDLPLQHVVRRLNGRQRAFFLKFCELLHIEIGRSDGAGFACFKKLPKTAR